MDKDPTIRNTLLALLAGTVLAVVVICATSAFAEQPECTADRHLDECGQLCPDTTTTTTVTSDTTTTTVAGTNPVCPDPPPCQTVQCKDGGTVIVDRCPRAEAYTPCNCRDEYKYEDDIWVPELAQWCHCAKRSTPARKFLPDSLTQ